MVHVRCRCGYLAAAWARHSFHLLQALQAQGVAARQALGPPLGRVELLQAHVALHGLEAHCKNGMYTGYENRMRHQVLLTEKTVKSI